MKLISLELVSSKECFTYASMLTLPCNLASMIIDRWLNTAYCTYWQFAQPIHVESLFGCFDCSHVTSERRYWCILPLCFSSTKCLAVMTCTKTIKNYCGCKNLATKGVRSFESCLICFNYVIFLQYEFYIFFSIGSGHPAKKKLKHSRNRWAPTVVHTRATGK